MGCSFSYKNYGRLYKYGAALLAAFVFQIQFISVFAQAVPKDSLVIIRDTAGINYSSDSNRLISDTAVVIDTTHHISIFDTIGRSSNDTTKIKIKYRHSPLKAALFSAALPGVGQAYNKHYWKIPIVYAGLGGLGYAIYYTNSNFRGYKMAYRAQEADPPNPYASYAGVSDAATLKEYRDYYKKYLDISCIATGVWYLLTVVDAAVDAHLSEWNMKDDISVSWHPTLINPGYGSAALAAGVAFSVNF